MTQVRLLAFLFAGLLLYLAFGESLTPTFQRRARQYRTKYGKYLTRSVLTQPLIFVVLGALMRDWLLTPFLLAVAGAIAYYRVRQAIEESGRIKVRQVLQLVATFRGAYSVQPAVFASLQETAKRTEGPLHDMASIAVETFFLTSSPERAFQEFRKRSDNILLRQFAYILEMGESTTPQVMLTVLDSFVARLRSHENLEEQVETGLATVRNETSFLQGTVVLVLFAVALVPLLRDVWVASTVWRLGYVALLSVGIGASYYVEQQTHALKEQIR